MHKSNRLRAIIVCLAAMISSSMQHASSQDEVQTFSETFAVPAAPIVVPPPLPDRPPLIRSQQPIYGRSRATIFNTTRTPLAWRAKAYYLSLQKGVGANCRVLKATFDEVMMSLLAAVSQAGLVVEALNSRAGHVLIADPKSAQKFVFSLSENTPGETTVRGSALTTSPSAFSVTQKLLDGTSTALSKRGAI